MDWDDLRTVLALARGGGLAAAAERLHVNPSTVFRRLAALEAGLGATLFERRGGVYRPQEAGFALIEAAERMEAEALAAERKVSGRDLRLTGTLRLTSSESMASRVLPSIVQRFRTLHPGIEVELAVDNRILSLTRREADIALRPTRPIEPELHGRKVAKVAWTVYGAAALLARQGAPATPAGMGAFPLIGWDTTSAAQTGAARWLKRQTGAIPVGFRVNSLITQLAAVKAGLGLAVLPCFLGDGESGVSRVFPPLAELDRELWLVTHEDLKATARVRAFMDEAAAALTALKPRLEGRTPDFSPT
jgi:DNA-binding transcriptional LysR family regulator